MWQELLCVFHVAAWSFYCNPGAGEEVVSGWWSKMPQPR